MFYIILMNLNLQTGRILFPINITFSRMPFHYTVERLVTNLTHMYWGFKSFKFKNMYGDYIPKLYYLFI